MIAPSLVTLLLVAGALAIFPCLLAGERRREWIHWDVGSYLFLLFVWFVAPLAGFQLELPLFTAVVLVVKIGALTLFLRSANERGGVNWSPPLVALFSCSIYLALVPSVLHLPVDGDEPYYVLLAESILNDGDVDLRNQYASMAASATRRLDLVPQSGDPVGTGGEQFSRHELLLPILLVPGLALAGLPGAVATIAIFGGLLVWSLLQLLREEGISDRTAITLWPLLAFGPPIVFYATRVWPEVPAAFFFCEALRALRTRRGARLMVCVLALGLLKIRFVPVAAVLAISSAAVFRDASEGLLRRRVLIGCMIGVALLLPLGIAWLTTGHPLMVHGISELGLQSPERYFTGFFGLLLDGQAGLLFNAPLLLSTFFVLFTRRSGNPDPSVIQQRAPAALWLGLVATTPYLLLLVSRSEWHGGWSPPLRYIVVFVPVLALGAAMLLDRVSAGPLLAVTAIFTAGITVHGLAWPWRLFHLADGENVMGETLSRIHQSDYSRLFPSFIRLNLAAVVASALFVLLVISFYLIRDRKMVVSGQWTCVVLSLILASGFVAGRNPSQVVHFEDEHVEHRSGVLYPHEWTVSRFLYQGGWTLNSADEVHFAFAGGVSKLTYSSPTGADVEINGHSYRLAGTEAAFRTIQLSQAVKGSRSYVKCIRGSVTLDRIEGE